MVNLTAYLGLAAELVGRRWDLDTQASTIVPRAENANFTDGVGKALFTLRALPLSSAVSPRVTLMPVARLSSALTDAATAYRGVQHRLMWCIPNEYQTVGLSWSLFTSSNLNNVTMPSSWWYGQWLSIEYAGKHIIALVVDAFTNVRTSIFLKHFIVTQLKHLRASS